jgi:hypothetical protein
MLARDDITVDSLALAPEDLTAILIKQNVPLTVRTAVHRSPDARIVAQYYATKVDQLSAKVATQKQALAQRQAALAGTSNRAVKKARWEAGCLSSPAVRPVAEGQPTSSGDAAPATTLVSNPCFYLLLPMH